MPVGIPNVFVQTKEKRIIMKIRGALVGMLLEVDPEKHKDFVSSEVQNKVLCVHMLKALRGMLSECFVLQET